MKDPSKIKYDLNQSLQTVLKNSFDADSKVCIITLIKVLDNVIQKPGNDKVRCIRLSNPNFWQKVGQRKGAIEYLTVCGFVRTMEPIEGGSGLQKQVTGALPKMELDKDVLMKDASAATPADPSAGYLQLLSDSEDTNVLLQARRQLVTCATLELRIPAQDLPKYKDPPFMDAAVAAAKRSAASASGAAFNIYQGSRFDGQAAATGVKTGPDSANYKSPTEQSLERLQQRQKQLEKKMQPDQIVDREWSVYRPGKQTSKISSLSTNMSEADMKEPPSSDAKLLAARAKQQMQERERAENGGFTTKAMRDLAKIKNQKVYSHTTLQIQFPDGCWVRGKFLPTEKVGSIERALRSECLRPELFQDEAKSIGIELYITPPRQVLKPPSSTIESHGLGPAAKVFVSFTKPIASVQLSSPGHYFHPDLIAKDKNEQNESESASLFPQAMPIQQEQQNQQGQEKPSANDADAQAKKKKKTKRNKEDDMLKRMMGGALGFGKRK